MTVGLYQLFLSSLSTPTPYSRRHCVVTFHNKACMNIVRANLLRFLSDKEHPLERSFNLSSMFHLYSCLVPIDLFQFRGPIIRKKICLDTNSIGFIY